VRRHFSLLLGTIVGYLLVRERHARLASERVAAAALESLLNAIDANDSQTGRHVRRVARYALILGDAADLTEHQLRAVERVALFHDVGKIHEALFDIIHDPNSLTPDERRAIATHPDRGAEVLSPLSPFYPDLAEGVLAHHERWDGTGYPRRLSGENIPLSARIVTLADTFDAITHGRRYRAGRSGHDAAKVILRGRGTQFDPQLVDLMLLPPVFERFEAVLQRALAPRVSRASGDDRRHGREKTRVPDLTFRWRRESSVQHAQDQPQQTSR
jgi:HD-GYP domain-containing protein (c-di-GMP phosphodiesterase class II)